MAEIWLDAYTSPSGTLFQVSNQGRVRRWLKTYERWRPVKGYMNRKGYKFICGRSDMKTWFKQVHRLVAEQFIPNPENKPQVDHINRGYVNRSDNRVVNLRWATRSENAQNQDAKGCYFNKRLQKWQAYIKIGDLRKHLGVFVTEAEARAAYLEAKRQYHPFYEP